jgi:hypothetical protein
MKEKNDWLGQNYTKCCGDQFDCFENCILRILKTIKYAKCVQK